MSAAGYWDWTSNLSGWPRCPRATVVIVCRLTFLCTMRQSWYQPKKWAMSTAVRVSALSPEWFQCWCDSEFNLATLPKPTALKLEEGCEHIGTGPNFCRHSTKVLVAPSSRHSHRHLDWLNRVWKPANGGFMCTHPLLSISSQPAGVLSENESPSIMISPRRTLCLNLSLKLYGYRWWFLFHQYTTQLLGVNCQVQRKKV